VAASSIQAAAKECMASVQERASKLEAAEVANMVALLGSAVETQMQRIELKLSHLDEINTLIHQEREQLERMRHSVLAERMVAKRHGGAPSVPAPPTSASTAIHLPPNTPSTMPPGGPQAANPVMPPSAPLAVAAMSTTAAPPNPAQPPTTAADGTAGRAGAGEV